MRSMGEIIKDMGARRSELLRESMDRKNNFGSTYAPPLSFFEKDPLMDPALQELEIELEAVKKIAKARLDREAKAKAEKAERDRAKRASKKAAERREWVAEIIREELQRALPERRSFLSFFRGAP